MYLRDELSVAGCATSRAFSSLCPRDELAGPGVIKLIEGAAIRWQSG